MEHVIVLVRMLLMKMLRLVNNIFIGIVDFD